MTSDADACRMIGGKGIMAHTLEARFLGAPVIKKRWAGSLFSVQ